MNRFVSSLRGHHSLYEPLLLVLLCPVVAVPSGELTMDTYADGTKE